MRCGLLLGPSVLECAAADDPRWSRNVLDVVEACGAALENVGALRIVEEEGRMHAVLAEIYRDHDAIICPTMATTGYPADATSAESVELAEGVRFANLVSQCLTQLCNIASRHPVLNVPSGRAGNGVPTGVQIVARLFDDLTAFRLGAAAEARLGLWNDPDWRPKLAHHG
ncbi:amidase family protein [Streptomyces europaeiscabiei]|uniref:amidase family protein n=1 Tax=Streptomyces europaeiscabiei TaxID=146819 RepID=UPI0038F7A7EB